MAIDPNSLEYQYRRGAGTHSGQQSTTYAIDFSSGGNNYTFIPTSVINKGATFNDESYVLPWFLSKENLGKLGETGQYIDLAGVSWYGDYLKDTVGASTTGFLVPQGSIPFDSKVSVVKGDVKGIGNTTEGPAYILDKQGSDGKYVASDGKVTTLTAGRSLLGKVFGGIGDDFSSAFNSALSSINDLGPWVNAAIAIASPPTAAAIASANAGQAAAQGDWERAALNAGKAAILSNVGAESGATGESAATPETSIDYYGGNYAGTETSSFLTPEQLAQYGSAAVPVTAEAITSDIAGATPAAESEIDYYGGNYAGTEASSFLTPDEIAYYGPISEAEMASATSAASSTGWTFKQALDAVRAGLLVNAITGDPLGLSGTTSGNVGSGSTGFEIVPVPTEWKSPTYAPSAAPIDLESIFSNQNMLGGTQWQNLPSQNNPTFNEIFASGQQYTPMGTPVDINQIVGSILGQTTTG